MLFHEHCTILIKYSMLIFFLFWRDLIKQNLSAKKFYGQYFMKNQVYKGSSQITYKFVDMKFQVCDIFSSKPNFLVYVGFHFITVFFVVVTNKIL